MGAALVSALTHELGMRVKEWLSGSNPRYHWLYRHEADTDGHLVTRLALSVAEDHLTAILRWLRSKFFARRFDGEVFPALTIAVRHSQNPQRLLRFHWAWIRALSQSLDPALFARSEVGERRPLVELLRIPHRWRDPSGAQTSK